MGVDNNTMLLQYQFHFKITTSNENYFLGEWCLALFSLDTNAQYNRALSSTLKKKKKKKVSENWESAQTSLNCLISLLLMSDLEKGIYHWTIMAARFVIGNWTQ